MLRRALPLVIGVSLTIAHAQTPDFRVIGEVDARTAIDRARATSKNNSVQFGRTVEAHLRRTSPDYDNAVVDVSRTADLMVSITGPVEALVHAASMRITAGETVDDLMWSPMVIVRVMSRTTDYAGPATFLLVRNGVVVLPTMATIESRVAPGEQNGGVFVQTETLYFAREVFLPGAHLVVQVARSPSSAVVTKRLWPEDLRRLH